MMIIGAGLTGLLCGALTPGSTIYEAGPERENEHKAVLRMRSDAISKFTGIPFKKVTVYKSIWFDGEEVQPSPRFGHMYSAKVSGIFSARSIFDIEPKERFIPPDNFVEQLKKRCNIKYNKKIQSTTDFLHLGTEPIISTIPMPAMSKISGLDIPFEEFNYSPIFINQYKVHNCDSYCTVYFPDPKNRVYRATLNGSTLIIEGVGKLTDDGFYIVLKALGLFGTSIHDPMITNHRQPLGKISKIDELKRKKFMYNLTVHQGIYSLGRFACWRPKVMLDDVLNDIFVIRRLIAGGNYASMKKIQGED